jgi:hypothetical protein
MKEFEKLIVIPMVLILLTACSTSSPFKSLTAGPCSGEQKQLVSSHISSQISAISKQDWPLAYSFAAKSFQDSVDIFSFEVVITGSYPMLINNQGVTFGKCEIKDTSISQEFTVNSGSEKSKLLYRLTSVDQKLGVESANIIEQSSSLTT